MKIVKGVRREKPKITKIKEPICDCQCPEPKDGAALVSETCPIHNDYHYAAKQSRLLGLEE